MTKDKRTKTSVLAATLEKMIYQGVFPPNTPLPGTREISEKSGVSQRVVLSALDILEQKDLVFRQERKRVFVKAREAAAGAKEILFFAFGDDLSSHTIYNAITDLMLKSGKDRKYDFFSRIVSSGDALSPGRMNRELSRLENLGFIDCALFYGGLISRESMSQWMRLPYPVIFLGELPDHETPPDGARILSPNSVDLPAAAAEYAIRQKAEHVVFCCWDEPAAREYGKRAMHKLTGVLNAGNMPFEIQLFSGKNMSEVRDQFENIFPEKAQILPDNTAVITWNIHSGRFASGELFSGIQHPRLHLICTEPHPVKPPVIRIGRDHSEFNKILLKMIESCRQPVRSGFLHKTADLHFFAENPETL